MAIITLAGLPIFGLFLFPILYFVIHNYISYLTGSNQYDLKKINIDDFEPDITVNSFHSITENELQRYPQVKESIEYFEGKQDVADLTYAQAYCDSGKCVTYFPIKKVEGAEFEKTFYFERCFALFEYGQNYYQMNCILPYDPPSYYFDGYNYGFWIVIIGIPVIGVVWVFHRWHVRGKEAAVRRPQG